MAITFYATAVESNFAAIRELQARGHREAFHVVVWGGRWVAAPWEPGPPLVGWGLASLYLHWHPLAQSGPAIAGWVSAPPSFPWCAV